MTTKAKRKVRKPRRFLMRGLTYAFIYYAGDAVSCPFGWRLNAKDCRKLAAWLQKAAFWLEHQEGK